MPDIALDAARIARPTADLAAARHFYEHLIGLPVLAEFADHDGFDGVVCALGEHAQFELVSPPGGCSPTPTVEDVVVLALDDAATDAVTRRLADHGAPEVAAGAETVNPYWWRAGARVFTDPDGYRVLIVPRGAL